MPFIFRQRGQVEEVRGVITRALAMPEARNIAIIKGHRAWLAWRDGDLVEAEIYGRASIEEKQGRQGVNAFRWAGLWPVIGVLLTQEKIAEAIDCVRMLLDTTQQPLSGEIEALLEGALQAWDAGHQEQAHALLQQTLPFAKIMGYL